MFGRRFEQARTDVANFRNGLPDDDFYTITPPATIEQVEVLERPASVLFGAGLAMLYVIYCNEWRLSHLLAIDY
ncbi:hypothetical protein DSM106972_026210 [Dulcicalothrix desertica PCC 7102]|uniref:Uncharacterized protein n=1 Tax=Dulcicalothrix desertica PCC 7102 TaxID=232991 RepID=A0A3S1B9D2_9CYAN|nr:Plug domain-containing protein [Dulcicalothrix desertica]RUT07360.1 hypothetical protein DSM106972_026210 [Dulcicalothrix desertica PCC 7102]